MPEATTALQNWAVLAVFLLVYLGMFLGGLPRLQLDRSGVAVLGAIAVIAIMGMPLEEAARSIDLPTLVLLFAFMLISAQLRLGGFYTAATRWVGRQPLSERGLLAALIATAGVLSAVFSNDIICLAMTPVVLQLCLERRLPPVPFLLGLACAANIGSAATLIGNPQNMLIGSVLQLPFAGYASAALLPVALSLLWLWVWLGFLSGRAALPQPPQPAPKALRATESPPTPTWDRWQSTKGLAVAGALLLVFLFTDWPPAPAALVGAGLLLLSRRMASSRVMGLVDWPLLLLFIGLFVVNHALGATGWPDRAVAMLDSLSVRLTEPLTLLVGSALLSNAVSNVPAVMLLLPYLQDSAAVQPLGTVLALASTFAGNLLLVGSIANLIVADLAQRQGIWIDWKTHWRTGLPVTLGSLLLVALLVAWPARSHAEEAAHASAGRLQPFTAQVVRVADGDSITVLTASREQQRIRLAGIDAPERQQPFSRRSREHLSDLLAGQTVRVEPGKLDRYDRMVAKVYVPQSVQQGAQAPWLDVSLAQLQAGLAWHYKEYEREQPREDRRAYAQAEDAARAARLGLWQDAQPLAPWEFRRQARAQQGQSR